MTVFITNGNFTVADAAIKTGSTIKLSIMDLFGNTSPSCSVNLLAAPAVDLLENTVYNIGQNVTLSTAAPNVKIYYNVRPLSEASDAFDNATKVEYTAPFAINENSKVIARVTKDNIVTSNVLLKKFKVKLPVPKFGIEYTPAYGAKMIPPAGIDNVKVMFKTSEAPAANPAEYTAIQTVTADNMTFTAYATVDKDNTAAATRKYENSDSVTSEPYRKAADMSAVKVYQKTNENKLALRNVTSAMEYSLSGTAQTAAPDGTWQTGTGAEIDLSAMESGKYIVVRDKNIPQLVRGMGRMYPALTNGIDAANTSNRWAINILEKKIRLTSINLGGQTVDSTNFKVYVTFKESGSANWIVINDRRNVDAPALGAPLYGMAARTGGYPVGTNIAPGEMAGVVMYTENKMSYYANEETGIFLINDNANGSDNANSADDIFCNASAAYTVKSPLDASKIYASGIDNKIYYQSALNGGSNSDYRLVSKIANNSTGTSYYRSKNALNALNDSMIITDAGVFEKLSGNDVLGFGNNTSLVYALEDSGRNTSPETRDGNIPSTPTADDLLKLGLEYKDASYLTLKNTNGPFSMASIALIVTPNNGADWYELGNIDAMNTALTPVTVPDSALIPIAKYSTASIIKYCYKHSTSGNISAVSAQDGEVVAATKFGSSLPVETGNPAPIPVYFSGSGVKVLNNISNVNTNLLTYTKVNNGSAVLEFGRVNFEKDATGTVVDMKIMIPAGALSNNESGWALKAHTDYNNIVSVSGGHVPASSMNLDAKFSREWGRLGTEAVNGTNGSVYAVAAHNNNIYVGGSFTTAGGISASRIAKWDGSNWS
ncbi:MAG: chitobiase/beta-hexosaminidase C-terminal domain-containing protein, partial [Candidatus Wallbacteria bacterium]